MMGPAVEQGRHQVVGRQLIAGQRVTHDVVEENGAQVGLVSAISPNFAKASSVGAKNRVISGRGEGVGQAGGFQRAPEGCEAPIVCKDLGNSGQGAARIRHFRGLGAQAGRDKD